MAKKLETKAGMPKSKRPKDAKRLMALRMKFGWSQKQLAEEFGVNPTTVAWWETGERNLSKMALRLLEIYEDHGNKVKR